MTQSFYLPPFEIKRGVQAILVAAWCQHDIIKLTYFHWTQAELLMSNFTGGPILTKFMGILSLLQAKQAVHKNVN